MLPGSARGCRTWSPWNRHQTYRPGGYHVEAKRLALLREVLHGAYTRLGLGEAVGVIGLLSRWCWRV